MHLEGDPEGDLVDEVVEEQPRRRLQRRGRGLEPRGQRRSQLRRLLLLLQERNSINSKDYILILRQSKSSSLFHSADESLYSHVVQINLCLHFTQCADIKKRADNEIELDADEYKLGVDILLSQMK